MPTTLVDFGYVSWTVAVMPGSINNWSTIHQPRLTRKKGCLILFDGPNNLRYKLVEGYKQHRKDKRDNDPEWAAKAQRVRDFQEFVYDDAALECIKRDGLEADDLVGIFSILSQEPISCIGIDKDLLQLPKVNLVTLNGKKRGIFDYQKKVPKAIAPHLFSTKSILLTLALMGDKSDDVERLVPARQFDDLLKIFRSRRPFSLAYETYGYKVIVNLMLTALPIITCFEDMSDMQFLESLDRGCYLENKLKPEYTELGEYILDATS